VEGTGLIPGVQAGAPGNFAVGQIAARTLSPAIVATQIAATTFGSDVTSFSTAGYNEPGDGGAAFYVRSAPTSGTGNLQSAGGQWWAIAETNLNVRQFGAKLDGKSDDTPSFLAAAEALPNRTGTILVPGGIAAINLLINFPGVIYRGANAGLARGEADPAENYWKPYDPTKPVVQLGDDTAVCIGSGVENVVLRGDAGSTQGEYGLILNGGAYLNICRNVRVMNFSRTNIGFVGGKHYPCSRNIIDGFSSVVHSPGAKALSFVDPVNSSTVFCNDNLISNGILNAGQNGNTLHSDSSGPNWLINIKADAGEAQVLIENTVGGVPYFKTANVGIDSPNSSDKLVHYTGSDFSSSLAGFPSPIFDGPSSVDGYVFASQERTAGSCSIGSPTLIVERSTGMSAGRWVLIYAPARTFSAQIQSVSGTTITLLSGSPVAVPKGTAVYVGDVSGGIITGAINNKAVAGPGLILYDPAKRDYGFASQQPYLFGSSGAGSVAPYNSHDMVWELGSKSLHLLQEVQTNLVPKIVSRSRDNVYIEFDIVLDAKVGDLIAVRGALEEGVNGTFQLVSVSGSTRVCYKSLVSQSETATGNIVVSIIRNLTISRGQISTSFSAAPSIGRPSNPQIGVSVFDTTIRRPIWFDGSEGSGWVDAIGASV
jgi:hypothetical protein